MTDHFKGKFVIVQPLDSVDHSQPHFSGCSQPSSSSSSRSGYRPLHSNQSIFLLRFSKLVTRQHNGLINSHRQSSMTPSDHHSTKNKFAQGTPAPRKTIEFVRKTCTDPDRAVRTDGLEDDVESRVCNWIPGELAGFHNANYYDGQSDPP